MTEKELYIAFLAAIPGIIIGLSGVVREWWRDRNRPKVDLSAAEKTEAEADQIKAQIIRDVLSQVAIEREGLLKRVERLERNEKFWVSFAREYWAGSKVLYEQVVKQNIEPPKFIPADKFPTGPLPAAGTAQT